MMFKEGICLMLLMFIECACRDTGISGDHQPVTDARDSVKAMPGFSHLILNDLDGEVRDASKLQNKAVFLNIWATWCKPCREEMPSIVEAMQSLNDSTIHFILASPETAADVMPFIEQHSYPVDYALIQNAEILDVVALPTTIIFNRAGKIVFSEAGYRNWNNPENLAMIKSMMQ